MARKFLILVLLMSICLSGVAAVKADGIGRPWKNHAAPYDFRFGNVIDTHQQMKLMSDDTLHGWIYIQVVEEENPYAPAGVPIARRADCVGNPNAVPPILPTDCRVGWEVIGIPVSKAILIQKGPRLWDMSQVLMSSDPEFLHFHWYHEDKYDMNTDEYNLNPYKPCKLIIGAEYNGYLFKRTAVTTFFWLGGNDDKEKGRLVEPGVDLHSNIKGIWSGGGSEDGHGGGEEPGGEDPGGDEDHGDGCGGSDAGGGGHESGS